MGIVCRQYRKVHLLVYLSCIAIRDCSSAGAACKYFSHNFQCDFIQTNSDPFVHINTSNVLQRVCFVHATIGLSFVYYSFKLIVANTMCLMVISYYIAMMMRKRYIWMLTLVWLAVLNMLKQSMLEDWLTLMLTEKEICDAMIALSWLMLRVTSFSLDYCNARHELSSGKCSDYGLQDFSTLNYLSYSFYMPVYLHGPPLIYERYRKMYSKNQLYRVEESLQRFRELVITLARIGCVYILNEFCMHFIYANVIIYNPDVSATLSCFFFFGSHFSN